MLKRLFDANPFNTPYTTANCSTQMEKSDFLQLTNLFCTYKSMADLCKQP